MSQRGEINVLKEFRDFIMRGNVLDLAVGIIIGAAFTTVVNSLVNDVLMPPIGVLIGGVDFSDIGITLKEASGDNPEVRINIGLFINAIINFLIVAAAVFVVVKAANEAMQRARRKGEETPEPPLEPTVEERMLETLQAMDAKLARLAPGSLPPTPAEPDIPPTSSGD